MQKDVNPNNAIKIVVSHVLQGMGTTNLVMMILSILASILERVEDVATTINECLHLLEEIIFLAKLVKQFKKR